MCSECTRNRICLSDGASNFFDFHLELGFWQYLLGFENLIFEVDKMIDCNFKCNGNKLEQNLLNELKLTIAMKMIIFAA